jgi:anti-sigma regulatory factor (Ser/Thr protein kinase)
MHLSLYSDLDEILRAKEALQRFAVEFKLPPGVAQAAELALDELLTNIVAYGEAGAQPNAIELTFELEADALKILISDAGICFNPFDSRDVPEPESDLSLEQRQLGGHGIQLVKEFIDTYSYQRQGARNVVTLRKLL